MQFNLLYLCHHPSLSIKFILKISQSWTKYSHEIINPIHAWNCSSEQMQFLKFNKTLSSCSNNSISTLQQKLLRVHVEKMPRKCREHTPIALKYSLKHYNDATLTKVKLLFIFKIWGLTFNKSCRTCVIQHILYLNQVLIQSLSISNSAIKTE
jgi:hypothetical protein